MAEISLEIFDTHDTDDWMVKIEGIYSYLNRKPVVKEGIFDYLNESMYEGILKAIFTKALAESKYVEDLESRYVEIAPSVMVDAANSLELMGLMKHSKDCTYTYSLLSSLDFCLGCIFNEDTAIVRERLEKKCELFDIDYKVLSYAIMTGNIAGLHHMNMQIFLDLTETLNEFINKIYLNPNTFVYNQGDRMISLANPLHTPESRIATFIIHKVLFFAQTLLNAIIAQFRDQIPPFVESTKGMLVSKGPYNVVLTAKQVFTPDILFTYGNNSLVLKPQKFRNIGD